MKIKKWMSIFLAFSILVVMSIGISAFAAGNDLVTSADVPDAALLNALQDIVGSDGSLTFNQLASYTGKLELKNKNISDLTGIKLAKKAVAVDAANNPISSVPVQCFASMMYLEEVILPDTVISIGESAFSKCYSLNNFVMPDSVITLGPSAFLNVEMSNITLSKNLTAISDNAFMNCVNLTKLDIPESVKSFGTDSFAYCTKLEKINIPSGITAIPQSAFEGCSSLSYLDFPESLETIGSNAFYKCTNMIGIYLPDHLRLIEEGAFLNCEKLSGISIGSNTVIGPNVFKNCPSLLSLDMRAVPTELAFMVGDTYTFTQQPLANGEWSSSNTAILTINSSTGIAKALKAGTAKVTYTGNLNGVTDTSLSKTKITFDVTVKETEAENIVVMKFDSTKAYVNGNVYNTTEYASGFAVLQNINGTAMMPLRYIAEVNGLEVVYDEATGMTRVVSKESGEYLTITPGSDLVLKYDAQGNQIGEAAKAPNPFIIQDGITVGPLRFTCEALGKKVFYQETGHGNYVVVSTFEKQPDEAAALIEGASALGL